MENLWNKMIHSSLVVAVVTIVMTLQSCIYYSSAFSISPSFYVSSSYVMQRSCLIIADGTSRRRTTPVALSASSSDDEESQQNKQDIELPDYDKEEILLKINLAIHPGVSTQEALHSVITYSQSFPFAAVLPVQPLTYLPTPDGNGVEIKFLRKKTTEKSAVDGGIRFFIKEIIPETTSPSVVGDGGAAPTTLSLDSSSSSNDNDIVEEKEEEYDEEDDEEVCVTDSSGTCITGSSIEITAKRNSVGQTIRKITAERLVVTAYVAGITGEEMEKYGRPPIDQVHVTSVFHKWLL